MNYILGAGRLRRPPLLLSSIWLTRKTDDNLIWLLLILLQPGGAPRSNKSRRTSLKWRMLASMGRIPFPLGTISIRLATALINYLPPLQNSDRLPIFHHGKPWIPPGHKLYLSHISSSWGSQLMRSLHRLNVVSSFVSSSSRHCHCSWRISPVSLISDIYSNYSEPTHVMVAPNNEGRTTKRTQSHSHRTSQLVVNNGTYDPNRSGVNLSTRH